jgi:hypothetical protein
MSMLNDARKLRVLHQISSLAGPSETCDRSEDDVLASEGVWLNKYEERDAHSTCTNERHGNRCTET